MLTLSVFPPIFEPFFGIEDRRCEKAGPEYTMYGQFSKFHVCFCGLDSGNLKFETVRTSKQHIGF